MTEPSDDEDGMASPPERRRKGRVAIAVLACVAVLVAGLGIYSSWALGGTATGSPVTIVIPEGASTAQIAGLLAAKGVIRSGFMFRVIARLRSVSHDFKPGTYLLRTGLGASGAIAALRAGVPPPIERVTIPEGETIGEIASIVAANTHVSTDAFMRAVARARVPAIVPPSARGSLEGLLFPKTYDLTPKTTATELVEMMLAQFRKETAPLRLTERARALGLTPYQVIIAASLIEKEAGLKREQPLVSSVIRNRLRDGIPLAIDATIQYLFIRRDGHPKNPLTTADTRVASPYNTYRIAALPPTPIAAPGLAAIQAELAPASTDYLYYRLCDPNRLSLGHAFAHTLQRRDALYARCRG